MSPIVTRIIMNLPRRVKKWRPKNRCVALRRVVVFLSHLPQGAETFRRAALFFSLAERAKTYRRGALSISLRMSLSLSFLVARGILKRALRVGVVEYLRNQRPCQADAHVPVRFLIPTPPCLPSTAYVMKVLEREVGLLDWRTTGGTTVRVTLRHDESAESTRVRLKLGETLDWFASCPFLEVRALGILSGKSSNETTLPTVGIDLGYRCPHPRAMCCGIPVPPLFARKALLPS